MAQRRIVIIGSGNVATHLALGFAAAGCPPVQVMSRDLQHAARLASCLPGCVAIDDLSRLDTTADLCLIATTDTSVAGIAAAMPHAGGIVAHTSGSVPIQALQPASESVAVLYPLQTFSRQARLDLAQVPFFTEASDPATHSAIDEFARMLSPRVSHADSRQRTILHIAGVLSCNFVNYLWQLTAETLAPEGYSLDVVRPLIEVTLDKAFAMDPEAAQTGPARRGDMATIKKHLGMLPAGTAAVYDLLSQAIVSHYHPSQAGSPTSRDRSN